MKKILIVLFSIILSACSVNNDSNEVANETVDTVEEIVLHNDFICESCVIENNSELHIDYLKLSMYLDEGKVKIVDEIFNSEFYLDDIVGVYNIAYSSDCGGTHTFILLGEEKVQSFEIGFRMDTDEITKKYILNNDPFYNKKIMDYDKNQYSALYNCSDFNVFTTCGGNIFYLEAEDGKQYYVDVYNKEIVKTRDEVHPYTESIRLNDFTGDNIYVGLMNDKTLKTFSVDFGEYTEEINDKPFINESGETIYAEFIFWETFDDLVKVYAVETDGDIYLYEHKYSEPVEDQVVIGRYSEEKVVDVSAKGENYVEEVEIKLSDESTLKFQGSLSNTVCLVSE